MSATWNTKYGTRRVRHDPPTLDEAIAAARGLTDNVDEQVEIAAALIGMSREDVRAALVKSKPPRKEATVTFTQTRNKAPRAVVVERKPTRRLGQVRTFGY